jgi:formate/nitrite transporter FocA (FNT family)
MSPRVQVRNRMNVVLQMVMAIIAAILLAQLWLFTVTLDAMENHAVSMNVAIAAVVCSVLACAAIWMLIRFFLRTEHTETGE